MRNLKGTLISAVIATALSAQIHGGYIIILLCPFIAWDLIMNLYRAIRKPETRRVAKMKFGIWLSVIAVIAGLHAYYARAARGYAESAAGAIAAYRSVHGTYPESLKETNFDSNGNRRWALTYSTGGGDPLLMYMATFTIFNSYKYDFSTRSWEYVPD